MTQGRGAKIFYLMSRRLGNNVKKLINVGKNTNPFFNIMGFNGSMLKGPL